MSGEQDTWTGSINSSEQAQAHHGKIPYPLHAHLSDRLLVSCITVLEDDRDKLLKFVKNVSLDSSNAIVMEQLEKKLLRSLEKRGPEVLKKGWVLAHAEGVVDSKDVCTRKYTPYQLRSVLQLMGLKQLRAHEVARCSFERLAVVCQQLEHKWKMEASERLEHSVEHEASEHRELGHRTPPLNDHPSPVQSCQVSERGSNEEERATGSKKVFDVTLARVQFVTLVGYALALTDRYRRKHLTDFIMSCSIRERRSSMIILFGGTSGCGKSTLASLTASRLGITTVLSTDFIRHMLRREVSKEDSPVLYASTYNAGESLPQDVKSTIPQHKELVLRGYAEQSRLVFDRLESVISVYEARREPLIVEGVHLTMENIAALMERHPSCIPFLIYISNDVKHKERFAVRAKYMALDSRSNRYIKFFDNIRSIQAALSDGADRYLIPKIDNTNVDRSLATIHAIVIKCLRKHFKGKVLWDAGEKKVQVMHEAIQHHLEDAWSSKAMLRTIRSKISKGEVLKRYFKTANLEANEDPEMSRLQETIFSHLLQFPESRDGALNFDSRTNTDSEFQSDSNACKSTLQRKGDAAIGRAKTARTLDDDPLVQEQLEGEEEEMSGRKQEDSIQPLLVQELEVVNLAQASPPEIHGEGEHATAAEGRRYGTMHHRQSAGRSSQLDKSSHRRSQGDEHSSRFRKIAHVRWSEDQEEHPNLYPPSHAHPSYRRHNRHPAHVDPPQDSAAAGRAYLSPLPRGRRAHRTHVLQPDKDPPAAQQELDPRSLSPNRSESASPTPEREMGNYVNEDDDAATVSVTSEDESASNASAHSNENDNGSESESEGRTLFDVDTCSWAPSIDVSQGEEERELQESTVMVTRGSVNRSSVTSGESEADDEMRRAV